MDQVDHVANRVTFWALMGGIGGLGYATWKGFPKPKTILTTATSCAMVATSLFGAERLAYLLVRDQFENASERQLVLTTHSIAGVMGGALNGYLFQKQALRGVVFCVPVMIGYGFIEMAWQRHLASRIQELKEDSRH